MREENVNKGAGGVRGNVLLPLIALLAIIAATFSVPQLVPSASATSNQGPEIYSACFTVQPPGEDLEAEWYTGTSAPGYVVQRHPEITNEADCRLDVIFPPNPTPTPTPTTPPEPEPTPTMAPEPTPAPEPEPTPVVEPEPTTLLVCDERTGQIREVNEYVPAPHERVVQSPSECVAPVQPMPQPEPRPVAVQPAPRERGPVRPSVVHTDMPDDATESQVDGARLVVSRLGLDVELEGHAVREDGVVNPVVGTVAWYEGYSSPCDPTEESLIASHYFDQFANLGDMVVDDLVVIECGSTVLAYQVIQVQVVNKLEIQWQDIEDQNYLVLFTCDGVDTNDDGYSESNVVVKTRFLGDVF